jgi:hypothetical protein
MALDPDFDDRVRLALDPGARAVDRMVSTALQRGRAVNGPRRTTWRLAFAAAAVLICALCVARQQAPVPRPLNEDFVFTRAGDVVMIQSASGETLILGPRKAGNVHPAGTGFVIVEGDTK